LRSDKPREFYNFSKKSATICLERRRSNGEGEGTRRSVSGRKVVA
jgi:hypothetical protein